MTQEYERWFRDTGQFLPPCDGLHDAAKLEPFKQWGWLVWSDAQAQLREAEKAVEVAIEDKEGTLDDFKEFKEEIRDAAWDGTSDECLSKVRKLVEA